MTPDDYARFGELMRLGGVWHGQRLLSKRFRARGDHADPPERLLRLVDLGQRRRSLASARE